jgi:WhiB family transcriptional regulator, redox-sensing transcriptional regulator
VTPTPAGLPRPDWVVKAACRAPHIDRDDFHPENKRAPQDAITRAKAVCAPCAVRALCLQWGNTISPRWGIFGGLTAHERRTRLARHGSVAA